MCIRDSYKGKEPDTQARPEDNDDDGGLHQGRIGKPLLGRVDKPELHTYGVDIAIAVAAEDDHPYGCLLYTSRCV